MNKYALVTGSSRGIGRATAIQLAQDGFDVIIHYNKSSDEASKVVEEIKKLGKESFSVKADLTKDDETIKMFEEISSKVESLNLLVNNAGFDWGYMFEDYSFEQMRHVMDIILWSKFTVTKLALPLLKNSNNASIVNISSRMGKEKTIKGISIYGPAEAGVIKFTQCCALEFADYKIRVNCVAPGLTRTKLNEEIFIRDEGSEEKAEELWNLMGKNNPSGRVGEPQDIANLISFLASSKSTYINGETIGINDGSNLG